MITATPRESLNIETATDWVKTYLSINDQDLLAESGDVTHDRAVSAAPPPPGPPSLDQMAEQWVRIFGNRKQNEETIDKDEFTK